MSLQQNVARITNKAVSTFKRAGTMTDDVNDNNLNNKSEVGKKLSVRKGQIN